jgi:CubicO group peptidase (beta-lactamase class C family)
MTQASFPRSIPESQGVSSAALLEFVNSANETIHELHSLMLLRHGQVVAEGWWAPYAPELPHTLFSLTKSFASTAIGLAEAEGKLALTDKVLSFFPEDLPETVDENLAKMEIRHLLTMSTGHHDDSTGRMIEGSKGNWVRGFLTLPVEHEPGTHFVYNSGASYILGAIIHKVTGVGLKAYLRPRLFEPLGIKTPRWDRCPQGLEIGGWGLHVRTEDIARLGQLYLQKGLWNGVRILPESWVKAASSKQVPNGSDPNNDWNQGYGYQFWRCRHNNFRGDGAFGQYCIVMPDQDAVLAITSGVGDMQAVMNLVWEKILPAINPAPLSQNPKAHDALSKALEGLTLRPTQGKVSSKLINKSGRYDFVFEANPFKLKGISFDFQDDNCTIYVQQGKKEEAVKCGWGEWKMSFSRIFSDRRTRQAGSCAWLSDSLLEVTLRQYETPSYYTLKCEFSEQEVRIQGATNVSFGPTEFPLLHGKAKNMKSP